MLFYLDNWVSTRPDLVMPRRGKAPASATPPPAGRALGLNENYARELMELHTLGVDGGYTQQDVTEVARCFTGWTIDQPRMDGTYLFRPRAHDPGAKRVLGHTIPAGGGEGDGERVIDILVRHPSTARFIATKLARHFVQDDPPAALVERMAATFRTTGGDIRAVMTTLITSPEFWSREAYRAKIKTPFEVVASAVRALDGGLGAGGGPRRRRGGGSELAREVGRLGQPLYEAQPPTGYPDRAESWVNTGCASRPDELSPCRSRTTASRRARAARCARERRGSIRARAGPRPLAAPSSCTEPPRPTPEPCSPPNSRAPRITRTTADDRVTRDTDVAKLAALVLGSPEFQRR
jgi:uncharacterized protein (DUF1800 family)